MPNVESDFWHRVEKTEGCWLWKGPSLCSRTGYGRFRLDGKDWRAHRFALMSVSAPPFDGAFACHHCDVKHCVRPDHLYWGTPRQNTDDAVARRLMLRGQDHGRAVVTEQQVETVWEKRALQWKVKAIADHIEVRPHVVYAILEGHHWKHVQEVPLLKPLPHGNSKITVAKVVQICVHLVRGTPQRQISADLKVGLSVVADISRDATWKNVPRPSGWDQRPRKVKVPSS